MSSLSITIDFITGRCVAADVSEREAAEWPPHPGRLFMALAAACFEEGEAEDEVMALEWLEQLDPPAVFASPACERSRVSVYVPVNDKVTASKSLLQSTPGLSRSKQERAFPTAIPEDTVVTYQWKDAEGADEHLPALQRVCANTIRVGHSSSLVRADASVGDSQPRGASWIPTTGQSQRRMRIVGQGELSRLRAACQADRIEQFAELVETIESKESDKTVVKEAKAVYESVFGEKYKKSSAKAPVPTPPMLGLWQGYRKVDDGEPSALNIVEGTHFDSQLLVLCKLEGPNVTAGDTLALTRRLRDAAMSCCEIQPPPAWLSGHEEDGSVTQAPHATFLALPYVGSTYADGHVMGLAIALPKRIAPEERGRVLRGLLLDETDEQKIVELRLGKLGEWTVRFESDNVGRRNLQNATWVGPSRYWASVTPVVLDRFPKSNRSKDRNAWNAEVCETIALSCERAGLPQPLSIDIDTTSWHRGVPRAYRKSRRVRGEPVPFGDGFVPMLAGNNKPPRPQIHVHLTFADRVIGPVLVGAGRFLGYGLCRPTKQVLKRF